MTYDPEATRAYFDQFAGREWDRLETTLQGRIKYAIHRRLLDAYVSPGMHVLDVGSGPGRFAIDVVRRGATVTLVDLSRVQLDLARVRLAEHGAIENVEGFHSLDVLNLTSLPESGYDVVVCFGGAVSYTTTRHVEALGQLARAARPGAAVLVSVMSLFGALRLAGPLDAAAFLENPQAHLDWRAVLAGDDVVYTNPSSPEFHRPLALFTARGLRRAMEAADLDVERVATANPLLPEYLRIPQISESPQAMASLTALEARLSDHPGLVDGGGHLLAVGRKRFPTPSQDAA